MQRAMKTRHLTSAMLLGLALMAGSAQTAGEGFPRHLGYGTQSCGTWTQHRRLGVSSSPTLVNQAWVLGFLTAMNASTWELGVSDGDLTKGTDADGLFAWIDNYCATHPLENIRDATLALDAELQGRN